ncbi:hypothetical protein DFR29_1414 [Tahibacter aquaticus]|uniref:DUF2169 domain-containing protein n=1 Tax=Tahibacter aquaticus TaxID=520092 RepID=A0A4R6YFG3_9GAMM|nr:DUF2169 domain-containing protein [Tahibacter aquaticus]TDR34958.1 hypothetical protein DFR29_1414 [Tahibacter aquaticus]
MEVVTASKYIAAAVAPVLDARGREYLVIVGKSTWQIPRPGQRPRPQAAQPFVESDSYVGEPGLSALRCSDDFARFKPRCDVVFDACAHAPRGEAVTELGVGFRVGPLAKALRVVGPRQWRRTLAGYQLGPPSAFVTLPLHLGFAHGGSRTYPGRDRQPLTDAYSDNPVGIGWMSRLSNETIDGMPAASLEDIADPITQPQHPHRPVTLGAIGRQWPSRQRFAGTSDDHWQRNVFPFLPEDFDEQYFQSAPEDQQMDFPRGGEAVKLINLDPEYPQLEFQLPPLVLPVRVLRRNYRSDLLDARADTVFFETEARRFSVVWRTQVPIARHVSEFELIALGDVDADWWRSRALGLDESCADCDKRDAFARRELPFP